MTHCSNMRNKESDPLMDTQHPQQQWQQAVTAYAEAVNRHVAQGCAQGQDTAQAPCPPAIDHLLDAWQLALHAINRPGIDEHQRQLFREAWPPAHDPLLPLLPSHGQGIAQVLLLDDGRLLARIGMPHDNGQVVQIDRNGVTPMISVEHFGRCPRRRYFALANAEGVRVTDGWGGPQVARLSWPHGLEGLPPGYPFDPFDLPPTPTRLLPLPDGRRVLLVSREGIFLLTPQGATRLLRREADILAQLADGTDPDDIALPLTQAHAALSPDGRRIVLGEQRGNHQVLDEHLEPLAEIVPAGEHPHFALFNHCGDQLLLNACQGDGGASLGVTLANLAIDPQVSMLQDGVQIHAGVARQGEYIVGDAQGYLRGFGEDGRAHWQHYLGSAISAMDISADGRTLVAASHAGFISLIALDSKRPAWQIGTGEHAEVRRWLFWKGWKKAMVW